MCWSLFPDNPAQGLLGLFFQACVKQNFVAVGTVAAGVTGHVDIVAAGIIGMWQRKLFSSEQPRRECDREGPGANFVNT